MKRLRKNLLAAAAGFVMVGGFTGCADHEHYHHHRHRRDHSYFNQNGVGSAPGGVTGSASGTLQNQLPATPRLTEPVRTESVMPGVGSALFPDPDGR